MADGPFGAMRNGATGVGAAQRWIDTISHNVANVSTYTRVGDEPFRARYPVLGEVGGDMTGNGVEVESIVRMEGDAPWVYDPEHPLALKQDADGDGRLDTEWRETTDAGQWVGVERGTGYRVLITPAADGGDPIAIAEDPELGNRLVADGQFDYTMDPAVNPSIFGVVQAPVMDMAGQLTDLIMASRQFQANTRVITAARETYESALTIGRS